MSPEHLYLLEKAKNYCAYQERCLFDIKAKLDSWKVSETIAMKILQTLEKENYLDEERYAMAFALGKLRHNKWGKNKIIFALHQKQVLDLYIQMAINSLDEEEYLNILKAVISSKRTTEALSFNEQAKLVAYAQQKGFQPSLAWKVVRGEI
ncbi:MAG: hypothetical protein COW63_19405 [Bacteroidetes bacterium CG18_big_fil_WC_8_21_14_2_50_41_14]|nr:MAG: hypothetical protein COW63_19405 [Bacteroidetes bacterium CG18_big_fil_WC_8_21_14_2_50_41_14]PJB55389.1 MAG: hypothetical protein CO098_16575 [Bacteroidetes bacterium CG_4_9_14_3_um_filter_41_19]